MLKRLSIRQKQMLIIMATSVVALLLAGIAFVAYEVIYFRDGMTANLSALASVIGNNSTAALSYQDPATAREVLSSLDKEKHIVSACIFDKDGQVFASYLRGERPFIFPPAGTTDRHQFSDTHEELFRQIELKGVRIGMIYLRSDLKELSTRLRQHAVIVAAVMGASLIVAFGLSLWLQRLVSEPILGLAKVAKVVSAEKNYALRMTKQAEDEVGQLIDDFNEMLGQIQHRDAALQAAHDTLEGRVQERTAELQQEVVERRRAEVGLKQQLTRICLLHTITRAIADRQDLDSVVQVVLRQLEEHLPIDFGRVYLFDAQAETISVATPSSQKRTPLGKTDFFSSGTSISEAGLAKCRSGETVVFRETNQGQTLIESKLREAGMLSALAVPLMVENELFGILLAARKEANSFSSGETEFLRMLSEQVALAAHQARLHAQLQKAYDELRQTQAAIMQQERLRALGQMASGIAHDINNALCPVVVYSDLLLQDVRTYSEVTVRNLQTIKTAGEDIAHIVSRMREFYRQRDKTDTLLPVSLNKTAEQVADLTRPRWRDIPQARGIVVELEMQLEPDLPAIAGNESELREALTNLILNSVDAMPQGGRVTIRTHAHARDRSADPTHVIVEVSDTGAGMDEETRARCLEPFFSTKGRRGTGLGLAMVFGIVERHEGSIEIDSEPGRGTTMRLIFPVRSSHHADSTTPAETPPKLPALHILCIDDEPLLREMLKQILEAGGQSVEVADGGESGLALFREAAKKGEHFDIVITDLGMPHLDGRQLSHVLKREAPDTPIIMLTGWGTMMKEDGDVPAQVDGVLSKPPKISELFAMVSELTTKKKAA